MSKILSLQDELIKSTFIVIIFINSILSYIIYTPIYAGDNPFIDEELYLNSLVPINTATTGTKFELKPGEKVIGRVDVETYLNIRTGPWGDIIGTFKGGDKCVIIGKVGDWYQIEYEGRIAYVHSAYVLLPGETSKPFPRKGWINAIWGVNVRRTPHGDIIGTLKDQTFVEILDDAGDYYKIKWGNNEAFVSKRYVNTEIPSAPENKDIEDIKFTGYVSAKEGLNVRTVPWGPIITTLPYGSSVKIVGKHYDWYRISYNGKIAYVHSNWIVKSEEELTKPTISDNIPPSELKKRIAYEARKLVGSKEFRGPEVAYGRLACAQVASTALKNAGAIDKVVLNVRTLVSILKAEGWQEVSAPPFQEGDVITWKTYDYTGDGIKDPDTHVGIIVKEGNSYLAMNNSSLIRQPRLSEPYSVGPITRVLRKV